MRHVVLSDDGVELAKNAHHRLLAVSSFPESTRDRRQALYIAKLEKEEFDLVGRDQYQPSEITSVTARLLENRNAQLYLSGFVGFVFLWLAFNGRKPSLNRAAIIASCSANAFKKVLWPPAFNPEGELRSKAATSDQASLERIFRQYRSVAHINAARVAASEFLAPLHIWDEAPMVLNSFVQSCALFQTTFETATDVKTWNLWDVKKHFPSSLSDWPPLGIGDDLMRWVTIGYDAAVEQGLINPHR